MKTRTLSITTAVVLTISSAHAQTATTPPASPPAYATPDYIRKPPVLPPSRDASKAARLRLQDVIETAMRTNLRINVQRENVRGFVESESGAFALFEPQLSARASRDSSRTPPASTVEGQAGAVFRNDLTSYSLSLSEHLPTATDINLRFGTSLSESRFANALSPEVVRSTFNASISQSLLRGFSFSGRVQMAPVLRARFGTEGAREQARYEAMLVVNLTELAYWDLVATIKSYEVATASLESARMQLELTRRQIAAGTTPESDLIGAESTLAQRQLQVVRAEVLIDQVSDRLRGLLHTPADEWDRPLLPTDTPEFLPISIAIEPALARAREGRPELRTTAIDLKRIALDLDVAKNNRLPLLDVGAGFGSTGQDEDFGPAFREVRKANAWNWSLGVTLQWAPLGVGARAQVRQLQSALRGNTLSRDAAEQDIRQSVRAAVRELEAATRQIYAAARSRELSERTLDVEMRKFSSGLTTNFVVAQRQADVATARQAEVDAVIAHQKAASNLQLATGELLEARRLSFTVGGSS